MPPRAPDLIGKRFTRLVVVERVVPSKSPILWQCICDCGKERVVRTQSLTEGQTRSCGCLWSEEQSKRSRRHGMSKTRIHSIWWGMVQRCTNPNITHYARYGARGISICQRWLTFENFVEDMGIPSDEMTIDRIDNDGNYEPGNCRWVSHRDNQRNKSTNRYVTVDGTTRCVMEWSEVTGIHHATIFSRLSSGWSERDAILTKPRSKRTCNAI